MRKNLFFGRKVRTGNHLGSLMGNFMTRLKAFTLSEVLITLVVVGIVSALTIPTLLSRQNEKAFKKMHTKVRLNVLNTLDMYMTDEGKSNLTSVGLNTTEGVNTYLNTYYRVNTVCGENPTSTKCLSSSYKTEAGEEATLPEGLQCIKSNDGATICMGPLNGDEGSILIDTNADKGPNIEGQDIITLTYQNDGMLGGKDALAAGALELVIKAGEGVSSVNPTKVALASGASHNVAPTYKPGYELDNITIVNGDCTPSDSSSTVLMGTENCTVRVNAKKSEYKLTVYNGADCKSTNPTGERVVHYDDTVNINAAEFVFGEFDRWSSSGSCTISDPFSKATSVKITDNCTVTSNCTLPAEVTINTVTGSGIDAISPNRTTIQVGQSQTLSVTPAAGYSFDKLTSNNTSVCVVSGNRVTVVSDAANSCTVTATATKNKYKLTVNKGTCSSVSGSADAVEFGATKAISANPETDGTFNGWSTSGGCTVSGNTVTMGAGDCTVTANCTAAPEKYALTVNAGACQSVTGAGQYAAGTSVSLSAKAKEGYEFTKFTKVMGNCTLNGSTVTTGEGNCSISAICTEKEKEKYTVTVVNNGCSAVSGGGTVEEGASVTVSATPEQGGSFTGWSGCETSTNSSFTFTPAKSCTITASCEAAATVHTLSVSSSDVNMGSVSADKSKLVEGETTNIYATNKSGYQFSGWKVTSGSCTVSGVSTATVTMADDDCVITANFEKQTYTLTASAGEGGTIKSINPNDGKIKFNESGTVTAEANDGYQFDKWTIIAGKCTISNVESIAPTVYMDQYSDCAINASFSKSDAPTEVTVTLKKIETIVGNVTDNVHDCPGGLSNVVRWHLVLTADKPVGHDFDLVYSIYTEDSVNGSAISSQILSGKKVTLAKGSTTVDSEYIDSTALCASNNLTTEQGWESVDILYNGASVPKQLSIDNYIYTFVSEDSETYEPSATKTVNISISLGDIVYEEIYDENDNIVSYSENRTITVNADSAVGHDLSFGVIFAQAENNESMEVSASDASCAAGSSSANVTLGAGAKVATVKYAEQLGDDIDGNFSHVIGKYITKLTVNGEEFTGNTVITKDDYRYVITSDINLLALDCSSSTPDYGTPHKLTFKKLGASAENMGTISGIYEGSYVFISPNRSPWLLQSVTEDKYSSDIISTSWNEINQGYNQNAENINTSNGTLTKIYGDLTYDAPAKWVTDSDGNFINFSGWKKEYGDCTIVDPTSAETAIIMGTTDCDISYALPAYQFVTYSGYDSTITSYRVSGYTYIDPTNSNVTDLIVPAVSSNVELNAGKVNGAYQFMSAPDAMCSNIGAPVVDQYTHYFTDVSITSKYLNSIEYKLPFTNTTSEYTASQFDSRWINNQNCQWTDNGLMVGGYCNIMVKCGSWE